LNNSSASAANGHDNDDDSHRVEEWRG